MEGRIFEGLVIERVTAQGVVSSLSLMTRNPQSVLLCHLTQTLTIQIDKIRGRNANSDRIQQLQPRLGKFKKSWGS